MAVGRAVACTAGALSGTQRPATRIATEHCDGGMFSDRRAVVTHVALRVCGRRIGLELSCNPAWTMLRSADEPLASQHVALFFCRAVGCAVGHL